MKTKRPILVAVDGSMASQVAAPFAVMLAQRENLAIQGLYVVSENCVLDDSARYRPELQIKQEPTSRAELANWFEQQGKTSIAWL